MTGAEVQACQREHVAQPCNDLREMSELLLEGGCVRDREGMVKAPELKNKELRFMVLGKVTAYKDTAHHLPLKS